MKKLFGMFALMFAAINFSAQAKEPGVIINTNTKTITLITTPIVERVNVSGLNEGDYLVIKRLQKKYQGQPTQTAPQAKDLTAQVTNTTGLNEGEYIRSKYPKAPSVTTTPAPAGRNKGTKAAKHSKSWMTSDQQKDLPTFRNLPENRD